METPNVERADQTQSTGSGFSRFLPWRNKGSLGNREVSEINMDDLEARGDARQCCKGTAAGVGIFAITVVCAAAAVGIGFLASALHKADGHHGSAAIAPYVGLACGGVILIGGSILSCVVGNDLCRK